MINQDVPSVDRTIHTTTSWLSKIGEELKQARAMLSKPVRTLRPEPEDAHAGVS